MRATLRKSPFRPSVLFAASLACLGQAALAQSAPEASLDPVVVTGGVGARAISQTPYSISVLDADTLHSAGPMINLSEAMARVPGIVVANRNNYAQDLQISSRGFGARAAFGVRGMRLYTDGIPATMPDGTGQVSHFDLAGAQRIEVLRGPFSALYGNSSGGVIAVFSQPAKEPTIEGGLDIGSFGLRQERLAFSSALGGGFDMRLSGTKMNIDGFRPQSKGSRDLGNARLGWTGDNDQVVVVANSVDQEALDPLGLTHAQFNADPRQTTPEAIRYDTRKDVRQVQLGANWRHFLQLGPLAETQISAYTGRRSVGQWQAIPPTTELNPRHGGGVVDFDRRYGGTDARLVWKWDRFQLVTGAALESLNDERAGYENFIGPAAAPTELGVTGRLRRSETNKATTRDGYAQGEWTVSDAVVASAGVRSGRVKMSTADHYLSNGNDSGALEFSYTNPVAGLRWTAAPGLVFTASAARGFESPSLAELAYRPDGSSGFNAGLKPQVSRQIELGSKWRTDALSVDFALFRINVADEIGVATNAGGRSSYQNVGHTRRTGAELGVDWRVAPAWKARVALTELNARYLDAFLTCAGTPCTTPTAPVAAGNRIAGTQRESGYAEMAWTPKSDREFALELRGGSSTTANDTNTDAAPGYGVLNFRAVKRYAVGDGSQLELLFRIDNLADKAYAGSVIVNDANGRYFETGAPRAFLLALRLTTHP